jgi:hypothetical protein
MSDILPWCGSPSEGANTPPIDDASCVSLSLFHVTGPYQLASFVLAKTGQDAIMAMVYGDAAPWAASRVFEDQCQAEYTGQKVLPRRLWNIFLAEIESPFGLIIQKSL